MSTLGKVKPEEGRALPAAPQEGHCRARSSGPCRNSQKSSQPPFCSPDDLRASAASFIEFGVCFLILSSFKTNAWFSSPRKGGCEVALHNVMCPRHR